MQLRFFNQNGESYGDLTVQPDGTVTASGLGEAISQPNGGFYMLPTVPGPSGGRVPVGPSEVTPADGVLWLWACSFYIGSRNDCVFDDEAIAALQDLGVPIEAEGVE
jgi:hypothetical protein